LARQSVVLTHSLKAYVPTHAFTARKQVMAVPVNR